MVTCYAGQASPNLEASAFWLTELSHLGGAETILGRPSLSLKETRKGAEPLMTRQQALSNHVRDRWIRSQPLNFVTEQRCLVQFDPRSSKIASPPQPDVCCERRSPRRATSAQGVCRLPPGGHAHGVQNKL